MRKTENVIFNDNLFNIIEGMNAIEIDFLIEKL